MTETKQKKKIYDLEERTTKFSENLILLCKKISKNSVNLPIVNQLIRSGTSVGANYCEANGASSKKDFTNKIYICKKEAKETQYWLRILSTATPMYKDNCKILWKEAKELTLIFAKIASKSK